MGRTGDEDAASAQDAPVVDEVDRRLVRDVFAPGRDRLEAERAPLKELAEAVDVHRNTVSSRLRKLREAGLFLPPVLGVDPTKLGHASGILHLEAPGGPPGEVDRETLFAMDGVEALITSMDGWEVPLHGRDPHEVERRSEVVASLVGAEDRRWILEPGPEDGAWDPVPVEDLDARVVEALVGDARRAFRDAAEDVGVSPKTVRRRYRRLREAGVLYFAPSGYTEARGATFVLVEVDTAEPPSGLKGAILGGVDDVLFPNFEGRERAVLFVWTPALARLSRQIQGLREVEGVTGVRQRVITGTRTNPRLSEWVGRMLRDSPG